jgi:hypothetical protein
LQQGTRLKEAIGLRICAGGYGILPVKRSRFLPIPSKIIQVIVMLINVSKKKKIIKLTSLEENKVFITLCQLRSILTV